MNTVLCENFRKHRIAKGMTQEQVAESLHVNAQTVSRWECGATLPDVLTLPLLARLYGVTVDDFYKKHSIAYDNYAQRLSAVYEKTCDPEDFLLCVLEYRKLMKDGELSAADKWNYATIHHFMLRDCKNKALAWYDSVIAEGSEADTHVYGRARSMRNKLLFELGRGEEVIVQQKEACARTPDMATEWDLLIEAYIFAKNYEKAYSVFCEAIVKFPNNGTLFIHGGDICKALKKYEEAFSCWDKAGEIGTYFHDEIYCKAYCYEDMGEYEKAAKMLFALAETLRSEHYDVEADMAEENARIMKSKVDA